MWGRFTAYAVAASSSGDIEGGAMIGRGADDRQPERQIDPVVEMQRLEGRQRLIVIAAEQRVISVANAGCEPCVGGERTIDDDPVLGQLGDRGLHHPLLLAAELAALARVRFQPRKRDARSIDAEIDLKSTR